MNQIQFGLEKAYLAKQGFIPTAKAYVVRNYQNYAARMNCRRCKAHGLRAEVWSKGIVVVVFAVCSACGFVEEM